MGEGAGQRPRERDELGLIAGRPQCVSPPGAGLVQGEESRRGAANCTHADVKRHVIGTL